MSSFSNTNEMLRHVLRVGAITLILNGLIASPQAGGITFPPLLRLFSGFPDLHRDFVGQGCPRNVLPYEIIKARF
jgi:hypothetical protein